MLLLLGWLINPRSIGQLQGVGQSGVSEAFRVGLPRGLHGLMPCLVHFSGEVECTSAGVWKPIPECRCS